MSDIDSELDPQEMAFERSAEMTWNGKKLEPFSHMRKTAAIRLGVVYWKLRPDDIITEVAETESREKIEVQYYDQLAQDISTVLWLCSTSDEECRRARREPAWAEPLIDAWAEGKVFDPGMRLKADAWLVFLAIVNDVTITQGEILSSEKKTVTQEKPKGSRKRSST